MHVASRVVPPRGGPSRRGLLGMLAPGVAGVAWLAIAGASAWLVFATPLLARLVALEASGSTPILGVVAWAAALTAPACFAIVGLARVASAVQHARASRQALPPVSRRADRLPPGCTAIARIRLPDGRRIPDVVVGPHGVAFFESLPPAAACRRAGDRWEVRFSDRSWRPIENPLQRAARDADRLRSHLEAEERDFVVRVQAAVLAEGHEVAPVEGCAVVDLADVPAWLAALPTQRGLSPDRQAHLRDVLAKLA